MKPNGYYTKEKCVKLCQKCVTKSEFRKKYNSAYIACSRNKWIYDINKILISSYKPNGFWNKKECLKEAKKYKHRNEFYKNAVGAHIACSRNGWLEEACSHMIKPNKTRKWTKEKCVEAARKCKTKSEFHKKYPTAASKCNKYNWMDIASKHMMIIGNIKNRCIYAYEFPDNHVYVGLTYDIDKRYDSKRSSYRRPNHKDAMIKYMDSTGLKPIRKQLTNYIPIEKAVKKEAYWQRKYKNEGWIAIHSARPGSIGGNAIKWTKENCFKKAIECKNRTEFAKTSAWAAAKNNGWLCKEMFFHMIVKEKPKGYWNIDTCSKEALKYKTRSEFQNKCKSAYTTASRNKWLNKICSHMKNLYISRGFWHKKMNCKIASKKCKNISQFASIYSRAYVISLKNKWLEEFFK